MAESFSPVGKFDRINRYECAGSQTIAKGDPVALDSSGQVIVATAVLTGLLGVAAHSVTSSTAGDEILVYDDPRAIFRTKCDNAAENLQATVGDTHDLVGSTGAFYVNLGATSTNVFKVRQIGSHMDPLLDGTFTTFDDGASLLVEIAAHQLGA